MDRSEVIPLSPRSTVSPSRRSLLLGAAAVAPLVALGAGGASAAGLGEFHDAAGLRMVDGSPWIHDDIHSVDFRVDTGGQVKTFHPSVRVTVPPSYLEDTDRRYPVLLLLHGGPGMFLDWSKTWGNAIEESEKHEVIIVMPDGGNGSFYSNANQPLPGREANWETFLMEQVLPFVHENFRTLPDRMAIAGLSMGGWGALALGQRYWGHFRSISSYSGPADCGITPAGLAVRAVIWGGPAADGFVDGFKYFGTSNLPGATWGHEPYPKVAKGYNPLENIDRYKGKRLFLRTGDGWWLDGFDQFRDLAQRIREKAESFSADLQESVVASTQTSFSKELDRAGIDHSFEVVNGATHTPDLWRASLTEDLPGIMEALDA